MINEFGETVDISNPETWTAEMIVAACRAVMDKEVAEKLLKMQQDD